MEKIDRLGWTAGISFQSYGVRVGIRANDFDALERARDYLPPEWKPAASNVVGRLYSLLVGRGPERPGVRRFNLLYGNAARITRSLDFETVLQVLESDLQLYIAESAPRRVFVHAGVVGWRGRGILIPGRSFSGKSTLVAELVRAGATYYSDEYAVLDQRGRVHAYPRKLGIRDNGGVRTARQTVESFGGVTGKEPLPVGLVLLTEYKKGGKWNPRPVSPGLGALALLGNSVSIQKRPDSAFPVLSKVAADAPVVKSLRGEAKNIVDYVLNLGG
jgi:hypothetical protein